MILYKTSGHRVSQSLASLRHLPIFFAAHDHRLRRSFRRGLSRQRGPGGHRRLVAGAPPRRHLSPNRPWPRRGPNCRSKSPRVTSGCAAPMSALRSTEQQLVQTTDQARQWRLELDAALTERSRLAERASRVERLDDELQQAQQAAADLRQQLADLRAASSRETSRLAAELGAQGEAVARLTTERDAARTLLDQSTQRAATLANELTELHTRADKDRAHAQEQLAAAARCQGRAGRPVQEPRQRDPRREVQALRRAEPGQPGHAARAAEDPAERVPGQGRAGLRTRKARTARRCRSRCAT